MIGKGEHDKSAFNLPECLKIIADRTHHRGLIGEIALGHVGFAWTINTVKRTRLSLGEKSEWDNARYRSYFCLDECCMDMFNKSFIKQPFMSV